MRKKKYYRLINNIGTWAAIVGWTLDSRGCFKCSNQYSMMLGDGNVRIDIAKITSLDLDRISFGATISIIPPNNYNKNPKDTINLLVEIPYFDYMNHVFKRVKTVRKIDKYTHTLLDLMDITSTLQKIK